MDILKISNDSLKLMLTEEDMIAYSLDCDNIENDKLRSVEVIREILRDAGKICGFVSDGEKFFVQLYASQRGECEIFVKRLDYPIISAIELHRDTEECLIPVPTANRGLFVYSFDDMSHMMHSCRGLKISNYLGGSAAYKDNGKRSYYLIIEERSPLPEEHGGHLCNKNTAYYINEHCKLICRDAVATLGDLA
ncbi:MAG: adaptor protein MecA [Ruminococcaceae bacterium]|nr:adaptor protein MecA [Oscillospiraceae bacterium]